MNTIRFLLTCGTSTAILNSLYLSNAALNGHTEVVRLLFSRGAACASSYSILHQKARLKAGLNI